MSRVLKGSAAESWTARQAVVWIAYRVEPHQAPPRVVLDQDLRFRWPEVMAALEARATGNPRSWPARTNLPTGTLNPAWGDLWRPPWHYRSVVRKWMRETGLAAPALLEQANQRRAKYDADAAAAELHDQELLRALQQLNEAVCRHELTAEGRQWLRVGPPQPRQELPRSAIDEVWTIAIQGDVVWSAAVGKPLSPRQASFHDLRFSSEQVRRQWPSGSRNLQPSLSRKRGPKPGRGNLAFERMLAALQSGEVTIAALENHKQVSLAAEYNVAGSTARKARERALKAYQAERLKGVI